MASCVIVRLVCATTLCNFIWISSVLAQAQGFGLVTGATTGTYIRFGQNIAQLARDKANLDVIVKESEGSLANIHRMNGIYGPENAVLGIVQSDVISYLKRSRKEHLLTSLRRIFPLHNEEVHLLARKDAKIESIRDLQNKIVVVGTKNSGTWVTAKNLLSLADVKPKKALAYPPAKAAAHVLDGKADAMFYVAGKPVRLFERFSDLDAKSAFQGLAQDVEFVSLDHKNILTEYVSSTITSKEYRWLDGGTNITTVAVKAVLVSFNFEEKFGKASARCNQLAYLAKLIKDNLRQLRRTGHPKWKEVKPDETDRQNGAWNHLQRDPCSTQPSQSLSKAEALEAFLQEGGR